MIERQTHAPDFVQPPLDLGLEESSAREPESSPAFMALLEAREAAIARRRSGSRAIAGAAFRALREGGLTIEEYRRLFPTRDETPSHLRRTHHEDELSPQRPLDYAQLAAGEGVYHRGDDER